MIPRNKFGMEIVVGMCRYEGLIYYHLFCLVFINSFDTFLVDYKICL
jgi:hypothetical protein